jgi:PPP family 3-phenylpropionic acid transporter
MPVTFRLSGYYFFYFAFVGAFSPYFGLYLQSKSFSAWDISLLMSQMQLMRLIGPFVWGTLADWGLCRQKIIRWSAALSLLGFSAFFLFDTLNPLLLAMAILAFFWSASLPLIETITFDYLSKQPGQYGRIRLWGSVGFIAAVLVIGWLLDRQPISSLLGASWLVLLGIFAFSLAIPDIPRQSEFVDGKSQKKLGEILFTPSVLTLLSSCFAMSAAHGALYIFYSIHLAEHGYSTTAIGLLWTLGVIAEIGVFMVMPNISARWSLRSILITCYLTAVIRFITIGWLIDWIFIAIFAQVLHGLTFGAHHAASITAINRWFPGSSQTRGQALYSSLSFGAGGLLGGLLSGYLWEHVGGQWTYSASALLALMGAWLVWQWLPHSSAPID